MVTDSAIVIAIEESPISMLCKNYSPIICDWGRGGEARSKGSSGSEDVARKPFKEKVTMP